MPCRLCRSRGWKCGAEDKVLGPKGQLAASEGWNVLSSFTAGQYVFPVRRISPVPEEQSLTSFDATLLSNFLEFQIAGYIVGDGPLLTHKWADSTYPIFSESFRYALLVRASRWRNHGTKLSTSNTCRYLDKTYRLIQRSALSGEYRDVVYTSYILWSYEYISRTSMPSSSKDRPLIHCLGMWQAFAAFEKVTQNVVFEEELIQMEDLAHWALRGEYKRLRNDLAGKPVQERIGRLLELLYATCRMGHWYWEDLRRRQKIWQLSTVFEIFSHLYVLLRNSDEGNEPDRHFIEVRLKMIVDQIIQLNPGIPDQWQPPLAGRYLDAERIIEVLESRPQFLSPYAWKGPDSTFWIRHFARLSSSRPCSRNLG